MKRILESPKIIVYENVEKLRKLLEGYYEEEYDTDFLIKVLDEFDIPKGKKTVMNMFENNMQATLVTDKKGVAKVVIAATK